MLRVTCTPGGDRSNFVNNGVTASVAENRQDSSNSNHGLINFDAIALSRDTLVFQATRRPDYGSLTVDSSYLEPAPCFCPSFYSTAVSSSFENVSLLKLLFFSPIALIYDSLSLSLLPSLSLSIALIYDCLSPLCVCVCVCVCVRVRARVCARSCCMR